MGGQKLSDTLILALGMTRDIGCPPPWLYNMQRYGPPPSYPTLKIPGVNAPIPDGCSFGTQPGGWGRPPLDEAGNPLFDLSAAAEERARRAQLDETLWGEVLEPEHEEQQEQDGSEG